MPMNTCKSGSWTISASYCSTFASTIVVPVPLPCLKPCKALCRTMALHSRLFTINVQTFQMTSTNPMPLYPPPHFSTSTIVVHVNALGMYPSRNATCVILTNVSHLLVSGSFSLVACRSHVFRCYAFMPNGPPIRPAQCF